MSSDATARAFGATILESSTRVVCVESELHGDVFNAEAQVQKEEYGFVMSAMRLRKTSINSSGVSAPLPLCVKDVSTLSRAE